jgi:predicted DNA-binding transcriptional regulator YafY
VRPRLASPEEVPRTLLGVGGDLEVLEPPDVRSALVALASGAVARHATQNA